MTSLLEVEDLHVSVGGVEILRGVDLVVGEGELHALMGPNGSGKSTLANALLGNPSYDITAGRLLLRGEDVTTWAPDVRAKAGMFLAFQYPEEIAGVPILQFLRQALSARAGDERSVLEVRMAMLEWMDRLGMDPAFGERHLNQGFSGGEKKRNEILQMALLEPELCVLDETDSGLDIDALRFVAEGVQAVRAKRPHMGVLLVTHYTRILEYLRPDVVHVLVDGKVVATGGAELATRRRGRIRAMAKVTAPAKVDAPALDVDSIRADFPLLERTVHGHPLVYLDSAASSQHPRAVLDAMDDYYETTHANVHRGVYAIAEEADRRFEAARSAVGRFIGAPHPSEEIIFTKNGTEAINLVAAAWGRHNLHPGDAIVLTEMEHHANLVPWLMLAEELGLELRWLDIDDDYRLDLSNLDRVLDGAKLVALTVMSNVLGTITPFATIAEAAHNAGALVLADGAQSVPHLPTDVTTLGCDFLTFSGHKMLGPTGIGVLWAPRHILDAMPPFLGGGGMIRDVRRDGYTANVLPWKFEAGTPPIAEAIGLGAAVAYLESVGLDAMHRHEDDLTTYAENLLAERFGDDITIFGPAGTDNRGGILSLAYRNVHPHDLAQVMDQSGVCIRAGHHCAKPLMRRLGVTATARASFYLYNSRSDIDALADSLTEAGTLFG